MTQKAREHLSVAAAVYSVNAIGDLAALAGDRELGDLLRAYQKKAVTEDDRKAARGVAFKSPLSNAIDRAAEPELLSALTARSHVLSIIGISAEATIGICSESLERAA